LNSPFHRRSASDIHKEQEGGNPLYLIREEIAILKKLDHENVVTLFEVLDDPEGDSLYMVLEMCEKGVIMKVGLDDTATPYPEEKCRMWFRDMILGIEYCSVPFNPFGYVVVVGLPVNSARAGYRSPRYQTRQPTTLQR
jgi:[calcium/calmodulin-dependent protein kinase] kinase